MNGEADPGIAAWVCGRVTPFGGPAMLAIGAIALRSGALLPRWLAFVALALGCALVTPLAGHVLGEYAVAT
jgi:hypothetical protein